MPEWHEKETPDHEIGDWIERAVAGSSYPIGTKALVIGYASMPDSYHVEVEDGGVLTWFGASIRATEPPEGHETPDQGGDIPLADPYADDPLIGVLRRIADNTEAVVELLRDRAAQNGYIQSRTTVDFDRIREENNEVFKDEAYAAAAGLQNTGGLDRATLRAARLAHEADNDGSRDCDA